MKKDWKYILAGALCLTAVFTVVPGKIVLASQKNVAIPAGIPKEVQKEIENRFDAEGLKKVYQTIFDSKLKKTDAEVVTAEKAKTVPVALTRLDNGKIAYSVKGTAFYPLAVETGWWDTRVDDNGVMNESSPKDVGDHFKEITDEEWNTYFADMANIGVNTVQLMTHWKDWQPKQDGKYDFSFLDKVTDLAARHGLKTELILFFHSQTDNIPREMDDFWGYHMDRIVSGGEEYALSMQWGLQDRKITSAKDVRDARDQLNGGAAGIENFMEYWHPDVFGKLTDALTALGEHFKESSNVIGYQIGNEEGFNYYVDGGNDKNPYYLELKEQWKKDHPGTSENIFRSDLINKLWICFTNALHKGDPYKPATTNTQGGEMEKGGWMNTQYTNDGTTLDLYKSVDMIGSMFYGNAGKLYPNLDKVYAKEKGQGYATGFPILFPTEISATMDGVAAQISAQTIARGGQGMGFYCYGELYHNFEQNGLSNPKDKKEKLTKLVATLKKIQSYIWSGVPVTKGNQNNIFLELENINDPNGKPTLTVSDTNDQKSLGVLHFPGYSNGGGKPFSATVNLTAKKPGIYHVGIYRTDNTEEVLQVEVKEEGTPVPFSIASSSDMTTYITVEAAEETGAEKKKITTNLTAYPASGYEHALEKWFDGSIGTVGKPGNIQNAPMRAEAEDLEKMRAEEAYIQYEFEHPVQLSGVELWTDYGKGQGILDFKIKIPDEKGEWKSIDENEHTAFHLEWPGNSKEIEKESVTFRRVQTDKVRLYITNVGNIWGEDVHPWHKCTMREISFITDNQ